MAKPKIIIFDLETLPNLSEALRVWTQLSQYPGKTLRATISSIICVGWKHLGGSKTECINAWDFKNWKKDVNDDYEVCKAFYEIVKDADAVITHNGIRFDWKYFQTRLVYHGLSPLHNIPHIDTKKLASQNLFSFNNKLGYLGEWLVNDTKLENGGWELWIEVHKRNEKAMKKMERYCKQDVRLLEKVFKKLRPFAKNLPNFDMWNEKDELVCASCGSENVYRNGWHHTKTRTYQRLVCKDCKSFSRLDAKDENPRSI
jgi:DNA polymerase elongation subunit (family B)